MSINFSPKYTITPKIMNCLMRIESAKEKVLHLPLTPTILRSLRETAHLYTTHYLFSPVILWVGLYLNKLGYLPYSSRIIS